MVGERAHWSSDLGAVLPIDESQIPGFKSWVCWNGFDKGNFSDLFLSEHEGFDFACYLRDDGEIVLGLPAIEVGAILDGVVRSVIESRVGSKAFRGYFKEVVIEHTIGGKKFYSEYGHIEPFVTKGERVKKEQIIARLYKTPQETMFLVRLHFGLLERYHSILRNPWHLWIRFLAKDQDWPSKHRDPIDVFPELGTYMCDPQDAREFVIVTFGPELRRPILVNCKERNFHPWKLKRHN